MKSFQITRLQPFEMIDELFADTVVICHHEELFIFYIVIKYSKT